MVGDSTMRGSCGLWSSGCCGEEPVAFSRGSIGGDFVSEQRKLGTVQQVDDTWNMNDSLTDAIRWSSAKAMRRLEREEDSTAVA